jgi:hypothetical protein
MDCPNGLLDQKQFSKIFGSYYPKGLLSIYGILKIGKHSNIIFFFIFIIGKAESFSTQIFNVFDTG